MCGIAGYFIKESPRLPLQEISARLFESIESRGGDASGYVYRTGEEQYLNYLKAPITAYELVHNAPLWKSWTEPTTLLMHTRARTQGSEHNNSNNHPLFDRETGLALIHNGWIFNDGEVASKFKLNRTAQVDTEVLLLMLVRTYAKRHKTWKAIQKSLKHLDGAFAVALIERDAPNHAWWIARSNPVCFAVNRDRTCLLFASRPTDLANGLGSHIADFKMWEMPDDCAYHVWWDGVRMRGRLYDLPDSPVSFNRYGYGYGSVWDNADLEFERRTCKVCTDGFYTEPTSSELTCKSCMKSGYYVEKPLTSQVDPSVTVRTTCILCKKPYTSVQGSKYVACIQCDKRYGLSITMDDILKGFHSWMEVSRNTRKVGGE